MNPIPTIKRFVLRALARTSGVPMPDESLSDAVSAAVTPKPLASDISQAKRELEADEFIQSQRDPLDDSLITWTLTPKGQHKAAQLA
jgi:hypothetical protein